MTGQMYFKIEFVQMGIIDFQYLLSGCVTVEKQIELLKVLPCGRATSYFTVDIKLVYQSCQSNHSKIFMLLYKSF